MILYHISKSDKIKTISPSIPDNYFTRNGYEDNKTKRVCFSDNIDGCIMGVNNNCENTEYYVYELEKCNKNYIVKPTKKQVPDVEITKEIWYTKTANVKLIGKIRVGKPTGPDLEFEYGTNVGVTGKWEWHWIERA